MHPISNWEFMRCLRGEMQGELCTFAGSLSAGDGCGALPSSRCCTSGPLWWFAGTHLWYVSHAPNAPCIWIQVRVKWWNDRTSSWRTWWLPVWSHLSSSSLTLARRLYAENWPENPTFEDWYNDTIHIFNQRVSMVNLSQTLIAVRGHYPRSAHPAYAECGQGLEVWELQLWAYMLHDCLQTDTCVSQMFVRELRSFLGIQNPTSWRSLRSDPLCSNSRCSTFAAAEAKTLTTTSVYTPPEVKAKTAVPFSEVLRSIFFNGFLAKMQLSLAWSK